MSDDQKPHARKEIREMTTSELRALVAQLRQRTDHLNEEMRTLQNDIAESAARIEARGQGTSDAEEESAAE